jgi:hypothetical protein
MLVLLRDPCRTTGSMLWSASSCCCACSIRGVAGLAVPRSAAEALASAAVGLPPRLLLPLLRLELLPLLRLELLPVLLTLLLLLPDLLPILTTGSMLCRSSSSSDRPAKAGGCSACCCLPVRTGANTAGASSTRLWLLRCWMPPDAAAAAGTGSAASGSRDGFLDVGLARAAAAAAAAVEEPACSAAAGSGGPRMSMEGSSSSWEAALPPAPPLLWVMLSMALLA